MQREEGGRGGGGVYANELQEKKKKKKRTTGFKLAVAREARVFGLQRMERRELDETFLDFTHALLSWSI